MPFELQISVKREPQQARPAGTEALGAVMPTVLCVVVNGDFDEAGSLDVIAAVTRLCSSGGDTVFIDMQDVRIAGEAFLERFADAVMSQRAAGCHLQVVARDQAVHATLAALPGSRDWLVHYGDGTVIARRRAIHVDRQSADTPYGA